MNPVPPLLISELIQEDPEMRDIVEDFVRELNDRAAELQSLFASSDWDGLTRLAHQLKGAGGSYGYPQISQLGATMEAEFKQQVGAEFAQHLQQLEALTLAARAGLRI